MASVNHWLGVGRLTRDPQMNGPALKFSVAIDRFGKDGGADFIDCVAFAELAKNMSSLLAKGRLVMVEGRLKLSTWETPEGAKRSKLEVNAFNIQLLDRPKEGREDGEPAATGTGRRNAEEESDGDSW